MGPQQGSLGASDPWPPNLLAARLACSGMPLLMPRRYADAAGATLILYLVLGPTEAHQAAGRRSHTSPALPIAVDERDVHVSAAPHPDPPCATPCPCPTATFQRLHGATVRGAARMPASTRERLSALAV